MNATNQPEKYSVEQTEEIIGRIVALRAHWLRAVEAQLAARQILNTNQDARA